MRSLIGTAGIGILSFASMVSGAVRYVDPAGTGTGGGLSWPTAFPNLPAAIAAASDNDTILISQGTFKPTTTTTRTISFDISKILIIRGGYGGNSNPSNPDQQGFVTILSGDIDDINDHTDNSHHVVKITETAGDENTVVLENVTIRHGYANGSGTDAYGGGIFIDDDVVATIRKCTIEDCYAQAFGGGVYVGDSAEPRIRTCVIDDNIAGQDGGGIWANNASLPRVLNTIVSDNTAQFGGGFASVAATGVRIISSEFTGNTATGIAGSPPISGEGGAIKIQGPGSDDTALELVNTLLVGNEASGTNGHGGAVFVNKGVGGVKNCTFDDNVAALGGAYYQANIPENPEAVIENSILWDNGENEVYVETDTLTIRESDVHEGVSGTDAAGGAVVNYDGSNINSDPLYATGHRLQCGSPCINNAALNYVALDTEDVNEDFTDDTYPARDRDLMIRVIAEVPDMGSFEFLGEGECCTGDTNGDNVVNVTDLLEVISAWGTCSACPANVAPNPCKDSAVNVTDLLAVIGTWGDCPGWCASGALGEPGAFPSDDYATASAACQHLSGGAWSECMMQEMCNLGHTEWCP